MSWFFGKKKHRESPPDSPEEESVPQDEGFIFVEKRANNVNDPDVKLPSLYPNLNDINSFQPTPNSLTKQNSLESGSHDLSNIPFKFCKELERNNDDLVIDKLRLNEIESFIKRVNMEDYDYPFDVERNVIAEMNSQNEE